MDIKDCRYEKVGNKIQVQIPEPYKVSKFNYHELSRDKNGYFLLSKNIVYECFCEGEESIFFAVDKDYGDEENYGDDEKVDFVILSEFQRDLLFKEQEEEKKKMNIKFDTCQSATFALLEKFENELSSNFEPVDSEGNLIAEFEDEEEKEEAILEFEKSVIEKFDETVNWETEDYSPLTFEGVKECLENLEDFNILGTIHCTTDVCLGVEDKDIMIFEDKSWYCEDGTYSADIDILKEEYQWEVDYILETGEDVQYVSLENDEYSVCETLQCLEELCQSYQQDIYVEFEQEIKNGFKEKFEDGEERLKYEKDCLERFLGIWEEERIEVRNQKELQFICENLSLSECGRLKDGNEIIAIVYTDESVYCENAGGGYQSIKEFKGTGCCDWKEIELIKKIYKNDEDFDISYEEDEEE
jgi:hypothetical protein